MVTTYLDLTSDHDTATINSGITHTPQTTKDSSHLLLRVVMEKLDTKAPGDTTSDLPQPNTPSSPPPPPPESTLRQRWKALTKVLLTPYKIPSPPLPPPSPPSTPSHPPATDPPHHPHRARLLVQHIAHILWSTPSPAHGFRQRHGQSYEAARADFVARYYRWDSSRPGALGGVVPDGGLADLGGEVCEGADGGVEGVGGEGWNGGGGEEV